ncbi:MAG: hypothetical protein GC160_25965 [Acidobacteria bacterium]|nr:hypothetical protein [Acidobacteriota bacterium]
MRRGFGFAAVALGLVAALGLGEVAVRLAGGETWSVQPDPSPDPFVRIREPDATLGWRNLPGRHATGDGWVTVLEDGSRRTSETPPEGAPEVWLMGGSFLYGQGLPDEQTLAWLLQARDPGRRYRNFGVSAYGTYQSLLLLEERLERQKAPETVLYGLIEHHAVRNIGRAMWLRALTRQASSVRPLLPYCSLDSEGRLVRHPAEAYPQTPLRDKLALVELLERSWAKRRSDGREADQQRITELLIVEMAELCRRRGIRFLLALLQDGVAGADTWELRAPRANGLPFVDCRVPLTPERRVPIDNHPNAEVQRMWADCVAEGLETGPPPKKSSESEPE